MSPKNRAGRGATRLDVREDNGCLWITLPDSINMDSYPGLEEQIESSMASSVNSIAIDLSKTKNMYSAGFGLIVRLKKMADAHNGRVYVVHAPRRVVDAMNYLGLQKVVTVYEEGASLDFLDSPASQREASNNL